MTKTRITANKVYYFVHHTDVWIQTSIKGRSFENEFVKIENNGTITIKGSNLDGYAWDGCSPKWHWLDLIWGTPDGKLDCRTDKPITYYASMFHDAIYQFKKEIPLSRKETDIIFTLILKETGFLWWKVYGFLAHLGGPIYGSWKTKTCTKEIEITSSSWLPEFSINTVTTILHSTDNK
jgi:hypothetical protein